MTNERNIYRVVLAIAVFYILFLKMCGPDGNCPDNIKSVSVDTSYIIDQFRSAWQKPTPDTIIIYSKRLLPKVIYRGRAPIVMMEHVDTALLLQDYFSKAYYRDSLQTQYGSVFVEDTVSQNRIQARRWQTNFSIPVITKTITDSIKPTNQVYIGFSGLLGQPYVGGEFNLTLKNKRDQQYEIGAGLFGNKIYYKIGTKLKFSFKHN
jgi:hypothetical protein